jgi:cytochrome b561
MGDRRGARYTAARDVLLLLHRSVGLTILAAMLARAAWRLLHRPPRLPPSIAKVERAIAHCTHFALYLLLLAMPLAGYLNAAAAGHAVSLFGLATIPPLISENDRLSQVAITIHLVGQYLVYFLVVLHVAGALRHGVAKRDSVLDRMLPVRR